MSPTPDVSQVDMPPYVTAAVVGLLHHAVTAVRSDPVSVIGVMSSRVT